MFLGERFPRFGEGLFDAFATGWLHAGGCLRPHNRWGTFRTLRERWLGHLHETRMRAVLLIDEAQELLPSVLAELRVLASTEFDSRAVLTVVLAGDGRLTEKMRHDDLRPSTRVFGCASPRTPPPARNSTSA
ncbi:MAG: AAA family ATPase [Bradyrhizobiaceae bacterium]|nr:AAA family ATPase [Bradyrhizobiaceae bacterium]